MPKSNKPGWVDWAKSPAREILLIDLEPPNGYLFLNPSQSAKNLWDNRYRKMPEFQHVVYDQYAERLKDHFARATKEWERSAEEEKAFKRDRELYPRKSKNIRGEPVFDIHPAKEMLRKCVKEKAHENMKPKELRETNPEFMAFKPRIFRHRIYQEVRFQKYCNYLESERERKKEEKKLAEKKRVAAEKKRVEEEKKRIEGEVEKRVAAAAAAMSNQMDLEVDEDYSMEIE